MVRMVKDNYGVAVAVQSEAMLDQTVSGSMPVGDAESLVYQIARTFQLKIIKDDDSFMLQE
jgi:transmembrane sensor